MTVLSKCGHAATCSTLSCSVCTVCTCTNTDIRVHHHLHGVRILMQADVCEANQEWKNIERNASTFI